MSQKIDRRSRCLLPPQLTSLLVALVTLCGCPSTHSSITSLPNRFEIESGDLIVRSDLKIKSDNALLTELKGIRQQLQETLDLPPPHRPVVIHLFADQQRYAQYMQARHPNLPARRAFFIGTPAELGVYAHWSPNVNEDLRHEYTHGVLHASLRSVPLWLDEGLAEYFEVTGTAGQIHPDHLPRLAMALKNGWRPDLRRLEMIEQVSEMNRADYQESWAWIHYLLHEAPGGRELLVDYCRSLRKSTKPPRFSTLVAQHFPDADIRLASYLSLSLAKDAHQVSWANR